MFEIVEDKIYKLSDARKIGSYCCKIIIIIFHFPNIY